MNKITAASIGAMSLSLLAPACALAQSQLGVVVGAGIETHDNAALADAADDKKSDVTRIGSVGVDFQRPDGAVQIDLGYLAEYRDYLHDRQDDETAWSGSSSLVWLAAPRLLDVRLAHQVSQQRVDRREVDVSSNRERRNVTSASANLYGHLSDVDTLVLTPGFTDVQVLGDTGTDSEQTSAAASLIHRLSTVSQVSLSVSHSAVSAEVDANDYDLDSATLAYSAQLARLSYSLEAGGNRITRDEFDDIDGYLARAGVEYDGGGFRWGASYVHQLTDSSIGLAGVEPGFVEFAPSDGNVGDFDVLETTESELHANYALSASSEITGSVGYLKYDYEQTLRDERDSSASLGYRYTVNERWNTGVSVRYNKAKFIDDSGGLEHEDNLVELFTDYRPGARLGLRFSVGRDERDSNLAGDDYIDAFAVLMLSYKVY